MRKALKRAINLNGFALFESKFLALLGIEGCIILWLVILGNAIPCLSMYNFYAKVCFFATCTNYRICHPSTYERAKFLLILMRLSRQIHFANKARYCSYPYNGRIVIEKGKKAILGLVVF